MWMFNVKKHSPTLYIRKGTPTEFCQRELISASPNYSVNLKQSFCFFHNCSYDFSISTYKATEKDVYGEDGGMKGKSPSYLLVECRFLPCVSLLMYVLKRSA